MIPKHQKNFQQLFKDKKYVSAKNYLYNYLIRKRSVQKRLNNQRAGWVLEVGSGISPLAGDGRNIVYSDISFKALSILKKSQTATNCVVADGAHLPFKANTYTCTICSEVLEHLPDDRPAISEIFRTLKKPDGRLILTVPHRWRYFGFDDRFVKHYRRYEITDIKKRLQTAGLEPVLIQKVLGPLEKATMLAVVYLFSIITGSKSLPGNGTNSLKSGFVDFMIFIFKWFNRFYMGYVWLDARIMPRSFSTVILIDSRVSHNKTPSYD